MKSIIAAIGFRTGVLDVLSRLKLRGKALVLLYHRVLEDQDAYCAPVEPGMFVTTGTFEKHLQFLQSRFIVVSVSELMQRIKNNKKIDFHCALTFDDGWLDNYENAYPLLEKYRIPATIFLATGFIGTDRWFWPEEVAYCLKLIKQGELDIDFFPFNFRDRIDTLRLPKPHSLETMIDSAINYLKNQPHSQREEILEKVRRLINNKPREKLMMNWEHVQLMADSGLITFGSHTVNHSLLDQMPSSQAEKEIYDSCRMIEDKTGNPCQTFAYPNGNYNDFIIETLNRRYIRQAYTTKRGYLTAETDLLKTPRIGIHEDISSSDPLLYWRLVI